MSLAIRMQICSTFHTASEGIARLIGSNILSLAKGFSFETVIENDNFAITVIFRIKIIKNV